MKNDLFLMAVLLFFYIFIKDAFPWAGMVVLLVFCRLRTKNCSFLVLGICMLLVLIPRWDMQKPTMTSGTVTEVKASYVVVRNGREKLLVYTNDPPNWGDKVSFTGKKKKITSAIGTFQSGFDAYCHRKGIYYSLYADTMQIHEEGRSFRGYLRKKCDLLEENARIFAYKFLLGISSKKMEDSFFYMHGASLTAVLALIQSFLKYFVVKRKREMIMIVLYGMSAALFGMPFMLVQGLLFRIVSLFHWRSDQRLGIVYLIILTTAPGTAFTAGFLLPAVYRIAGCFCRGSKLVTSYSAMIIQNILFHTIDPIGMLIFLYMRPVIGIVWLCTFVCVLGKASWFTGLIHCMDCCLSFLQYTALPGSIIGAGLFFYILLILCCKKNRLSYAFAYLLIFQALGLFHPFAEISFINVGQGDSILLRAPLNQGNILVDTGKPSAYSQVETILKAKGIRKLDALCISHSDDDHDGNREKIIDVYHPKKVLDVKHGPVTVAGMTFIDVNPIVNEDPNQSSLTELVRFNGLDVLLTGDIDKQSEEAILHQFPSLSSTLLKLPHHGSGTSSSEAFLDTLRPQLAVISSGPYHLYHHPSNEVIQRLLKRHIPYMHTLTDGDITILAVGRCNLVLTTSGKIAVLHQK